jgi:DNA-binding phage protein
MDKRYKPLSNIEQMQKRQYVFETISQNPDWPISKVSRFIRDELHLTLQEMSKLTNISRQTLQKLEQPNGNPTLKTITQLLSTFGMALSIKVQN